METKLTPGRRYTHRQAFTIWLSGKDKDEWRFWLDDQGFHRCEVCKTISDNVDLIVACKPGTDEIDEEWFACLDSCDAILREQLGIDENGQPLGK